ncbi:MAG: flagellar filament capping protein FliD [Candidatus Hydrogenedentes bacterium]|nr:flagellar filament capping protein FliD [Candidatus Hydrogenedentota bacterium]
MSGGFSVGGLITGLDSNSIIRQLIQLERQPILRLQDRISILTQRQTAVRELRTTLTDLRNRAQDFRFNNIFSQFAATSSEESVLTAEISGSSPVSGSYSVNVIQLASATVATSSASLGSPIDPNATLENSGITTEIEAGTFSINGVQFTVDPTTDSLNSILNAINSSAAGVTATYNATTDRVTIANTAANDTSVINFGATDDDSNFLEVIRVDQATQTTGTGGSTEVTSTRNLGAINPTDVLNTVNFAGGAITSGSFRVNGISINVDASVDSLSDILGRINDSDAGVTASYDASTDTIRVVSETLGSRTINFASDTSNFLNVTNLATATQTAGNDSQFTINGGATLTRNTNEVADAIGGVTLNLQSVGTSTVTVSVDDDAILEDVQEFVDEFNASVAAIRGIVGQGGLLENDSSIRFIEDFLRGNVFSTVSGISGTFKTLTQVGISTGDSFDSSSLSELQIDEDAFREALRTNRGNVEDLFSNSGETGIADLFFEYLDEATSTQGFLNERVRSNGIFDQQIQSLNDQIDRLEDRVAQKEQRLRLQFSKLEQLSATYQSQGAALSAIGGGLSIF